MLDSLVAETQIRAIHLRYCRAADRLDEGLFRSCFHLDAQFDFPAYKGGLDGFVAMAWETLRHFEVTQHFVGNQSVELNGPHAWAEHYTMASHRICDEAGSLRDYVAYLRYVDRLEYRQYWAIAARTLVVDMHRTDPVPDVGPPPRAPGGRRDREDPSYAVLDAITA